MAVGSVVLAGCQGSVSDPAAGPVRGPTELPPEQTPDVCEPATPVRVLPRLTRDQFRYSVEALFPAALVSYAGYPEADEISALSNQQAGSLLDITVAVAEEASADVAALLNCATPDDHRACVEEYLRWQLPRAFRKPVTDEVITRYLELQQELEASQGFRASVSGLVTTILMAPEFLYLEEDPAVDGFVSEFDLAARMSFFLWHQTPDDELLRAAGAGELDTPDGVRMTAMRLLADERSERGYRAFVESWLEIERLELPVDVDTEQPLVLANSMRDSLVRGLVQTFRSGSFSDLFASETLWVDPVLGAHLGVDVPAEWAERTLPDRRGLLTHPALLASNGAPTEDGRVIHRGVFFYEAFLCAEFGAPPPDAVTSGETRTESPACMGCHTRIDPVGFAFEGFDSGGRVMGAAPLERSGELFGTDIEGAFSGIGELSERVAASRTAQRCFARKLTSHAVGRALGREEGCVADEFASELESAPLAEVMIRIVTSDLFRQQATEPATQEESP